MAYILDAAVILIFLLMLAIGYKRGLVKSLLRLGGSLLAMLAAWGIAAAVAAPIFDAAVAPGLQKLAAENITAADAATLNEQLTTLLDKLPGPIANGLAACGAGSAEEIAAHLGGVVGTTADAVADALVNNVFRPVGGDADPDGEFPTAVYRADDYRAFPRQPDQQGVPSSAAAAGGRPARCAARRGRGCCPGAGRGHGDADDGRFHDRECAHFPTGYRKYRSRQCGCADQSGYRNA